MELSAFRVLIEQLGDLTPVQREALAKALGNDGSTGVDRHAILTPRRG